MISAHKPLIEISSFKAAVSSLKSRGQYRNVNVTLSEDILKAYMDGDFNFIFNGFLLPEARSSQPTSDPNIGELISAFSKISAQKEESVKEIVKHFLLEKFSSKNVNVESWCDQFEKESARFSLSGTKQIEVLKSFLDLSMTDWFAMGQRKFELDAGWKIWKADLIETFGDSSWKSIRYAYNFKYFSGSFVDYVLKKQNLLSELNRELPEIVVLDLIILGLPTHIQNTFNTKTLNSIKTLHEKLKKFENNNFENKYKIKENVENKNKIENFKNNKINKNKNIYTPNNNSSKPFCERKPCSICSERGFENRYHPKTICRFREKDFEKLVNNVNGDDSLTTLEDESKN
ncbi:hypothetical protein PGB90_000948 [Kerria lacca]